MSWQQLPPAEPEPQQTPQRPSWLKRLGPVGAGLVVIFAKFKTIVIFLLQFKLIAVLWKSAAIGWTFVLSLVLYMTFFGWKMGVVFALVLLAHEFGHFFAFRAYGLPVRLPVFIPFLGAYTQGGIAPSLEDDAYIALAGPLTGLLIGAAAYMAAIAWGDPFWLAVADVSTFLNLFNMIPVSPFDGGRVIAAVWPPLWIAGFIIFIVLCIVTHISLLFVIIIGLVGLPSMIAAMRGNVDPRAAALTVFARARVATWYLLTAFGLLYIGGQAHSAVAGIMAR